MRVVVMEIVREIFVHEPLLDGDTKIKVHRGRPGAREGEVERGILLAGSKRPARKAYG
jgi:hypothetical protein